MSREKWRSCPTREERLTTFGSSWSLCLEEFIRPRRSLYSTELVNYSECVSGPLPLRKKSGRARLRRVTCKEDSVLGNSTLGETRESRRISGLRGPYLETSLSTRSVGCDGVWEG